MTVKNGALERVRNANRMSRIGRSSLYRGMAEDGSDRKRAQEAQLSMKRGTRNTPHALLVTAAALPLRREVPGRFDGPGHPSSPLSLAALLPFVTVGNVHPRRVRLRGRRHAPHERYVVGGYRGKAALPQEDIHLTTVVLAMEHHME